jgi:hypothetical protein
MGISRIMLALVLCSSTAAVLADEFSIQSGPTQTVLIELYTSEGCNSCPPAERFLNDFVSHKQLWRTYIPLAFHVDYWDYLGWRDTFATPTNTQRQRTYGKVLGARTIYTPEFFVNGREWRRGFFGGEPHAATAQVGTLKASLRDSRLVATFAPANTYTQPLELHAVIAGMGLASNIRAGENAGRSTTHQFVVLAHTRVASDNLHWQMSLAVPGEHQPGRKALVVWVSESNNPAPIQAAGGFIPR